MQGVTGSSPVVSTIKEKEMPKGISFSFIPEHLGFTETVTVKMLCIFNAITLTAESPN